MPVWLTTLFTALPEIIGGVKALVGLFREAKRKGWIEAGRNLAAEINGAQTDEERKKLAQRLFNHNNP